VAPVEGREKIGSGCPGFMRCGSEKLEVGNPSKRKDTGALKHKKIIFDIG